MIQEHATAAAASGEREARRREQARAWMWSLVDAGPAPGLPRAIRRSRAASPALERDVEASRTTPAAAARTLLESFLQA